MYFLYSTPGLGTTALGAVFSVELPIFPVESVTICLLIYPLPSRTYYEASVLLVSEKPEKMSGFVN